MGRRSGSKGFRYLVNIQPVIPISISENWNVDLAHDLADHPPDRHVRSPRTLHAGRHRRPHAEPVPFGVQTEASYDWANSKWTVPLIAPVSQVLKVYGQPISLQLAPKWYAEGPTGAPDWGIRFAVILLFPKK